jgi:hypothetical protein
MTGFPGFEYDPLFILLPWGKRSVETYSQEFSAGFVYCKVPVFYAFLLPVQLQKINIMSRWVFSGINP